MSWGNSYWRVETPFQVYKHVGMSETNSYYGSSRISTMVLEAVNARPGDEIYAVAGGTFLKRAQDGELIELTLRPPKPPFEKTYLPMTDGDILEGRSKKGAVVSIPAPARQPDYASARQAASKQLPSLHPQVIHREDSPELTRLKAITEGFVARLQGEAVVMYQDIDAYGGPKANVNCGEAVVDITAARSGVYIVNLPGDAPCGRFEPRASQVAGRKSFIIRAIDGFDPEPDIVELLTNYADHLTAAPALAP